MAFTIGKRQIAYPPIPRPTVGGGPFFSTGAGANSPKVAAVMTAITGAAAWCGAPVTYSYQWWIGTHTAYASATNASYSLSAGDAGSYLTCAVSGLNASWGTSYVHVATGTIIA